MEAANKLPTTLFTNIMLCRSSRNTKNEFTRTRCGSMLVLTAIAGLVILLVMAVFFCLVAMLHKHDTLNSVARQLALDCVVKFNDQDSAGHLNNLISCNRELIYESRNILNEVNTNYRHFQPLAQQIVDDSMQGNTIIMAERVNWIQYQYDCTRRYLKQARSNQTSLAGLISLFKDEGFDPESLDCQIGYRAGMESNVSAGDGNQELILYDKGQNFIDNRDNLYYPNIDLPLPPIDGQNAIHFSLSPLAAPVAGSVAPARLTLNSRFRSLSVLFQHGKELPCGISTVIPSAIQIGISKQVGQPDKPKSNPTSKLNIEPVNTATNESTNLSASASALTAGALPFP